MGCRRTGRSLAAATACLLICVAVGESSALASFPGRNGKIAFIRGTSDGGKVPKARELIGDLYVIDQDGSGRRLVLRHVWDASFSPDGKRLVLLRGSAFRNVVVVARADGSHLQRVTGIARHNHVCFAADGRTIVFSELESRTATAYPRLRYAAQSSIYATNPRRGRLRRVLRARGIFYGISPAPTGSRIAAVRAGIPRPGADAAAELFTVRLDGSHRTRRYTESVEFGMTDFSPDGRSLLFANLLVTGADPSTGSGFEQIPGTERETDYGGVWSPDGQSVVFGRTPTGQDVIEPYLVPAAGGTVTRLTGSPNHYEVPVAWQSLP